jgi:hypothetical protein
MIKSLGGAAFENTPGKVSGKHRVHEKPGMRAVMDNVFNAIMLDIKYEAGIKAHQGRELIMHEKLEARNGINKTTPKDKYDVNNAVKTLLYESNSKPMIKSLGVTASENTLDKTSGKHRVHGKPGIRAVTGDIMDDIMDEKPVQGWDAQDQAQERERGHH